MDFDRTAELANKGLIGFDLALGLGATLAPDQTLRVLGHDHPNADAREIFRRCGPIWLTFCAAHIVAAKRGSEADWTALAWLRGTELFTDVLWANSPAVSRPGAKVMLRLAGLGNLAFVVGFSRLAKQRRRAR